MGDPATNGLGHKQIKRNGIDLVVVPGLKIWKVKSSEKLQTVQKQVISSGENPVSSNQVFRRRIVDRFL
jgi:hypothetical protein